MTKWIYRFSSMSANLSHINSVDQSCNIMEDNLQNLLGNKGVTLAQMFSQKLPIPHGFIISTKLFVTICKIMILYQVISYLI
ncbi:pyruvate phosphate dikinase, PEP/pyruvate binding domain protein [Orientia tsutsugamushi str. Sido]|nr:pyruvate phosphate dikinase, PEP/pyruvate binding domain protein [Orientia tsutsugamushi str. Sido]